MLVGHVGLILEYLGYLLLHLESLMANNGMEVISVAYPGQGAAGELAARNA
jgi:hypothetical protein